MCIDITAAAVNFVTTEFATYATEFCQISLGMDPGMAAIIFGATAIVAGSTGAIIGGLVGTRINASNDMLFILCVVFMILVLPFGLPICYMDNPVPFFILLVIGELFLFFPTGLGSTLVARIVEPEYRSMSLAIQITLMRALGSAPSPVIVGQLFDQQCIQQDTNGLNCLAYNVQGVRTTFFLTLLIPLVTSIVATILSLYFWRRQIRKQGGVGNDSSLALTGDPSEGTKLASVSLVSLATSSSAADTA